MLKPQDVVVLSKLIANQESRNWKQSELAQHLCMSVSTINGSLKRLERSNLIFINQGRIVDDIVPNYYPIEKACAEFLISSVRYWFYAKTGAITAGVPTSYASPIMKKYTSQSSDPIPVWPYAEGKERGTTLKPLYRSVPKAITLYPDQSFYELLCLIDVLRYSNVREKQKAIELIKYKIAKI